MKNFKLVVTSVLASVLMLFLLYIGFVIVKTMSYAVFYESMVKQTVREMVTKESLK